MYVADMGMCKSTGTNPFWWVWALFPLKLCQYVKKQQSMVNLVELDFTRYIAV